MWRSEGNLQKFSPSIMWFLGLNSGYQAWQQAPLPAKPHLQNLNLLINIFSLPFPVISKYHFTLYF